MAPLLHSDGPLGGLGTGENLKRAWTSGPWLVKAKCFRVWLVVSCRRGVPAVWKVKVRGGGRSPRAGVTVREKVREDLDVLGVPLPALPGSRFAPPEARPGWAEKVSPAQGPRSRGRSAGQPGKPLHLLSLALMPQLTSGTKHGVCLFLTLAFWNQSFFGDVIFGRNMKVLCT